MIDGGDPAQGVRAAPSRSRWIGTVRASVCFAGGVAACAVAFGLRANGPVSKSPASVPPDVAAEVAPPGRAEVDRLVRDAEVRRVVREELASALADERGRLATALAAELAESAAATEPAASNEELEKQRQARDDAVGVVERARTSGRWTVEHRSELRGRLRTVTAEARREILSKLFTSLNRGELVPEALPPL
jgi:hypothetical protein